jgi:hypothetical protein
MAKILIITNLSSSPTPTPEVEIIGQSVPLHHPQRRVKFLIEWKDKTLTVILDDSETVGMLNSLLLVLLLL